MLSLLPTFWLYLEPFWVKENSIKLPNLSITPVYKPKPTAICLDGLVFHNKLAFTQEAQI
jgi:hypothetical protein